MLTPTSNDNRNSWERIAPVIAQPLSASVAIIPVFYGLEVKSAQQCGEKTPKFSLSSIKGGLKASPTIGVIVGTQMVAQNFFEKILSPEDGGKQAPTFSTMLLSSTFVGAISTPALAVFNGQTMGKKMIETLKSLSAKQTGAILTRETSFLFALRTIKPVSDGMKQVFGDNKGVEYSSTFITGAIGSIIGHPADTALTLWQKGIKVSSPKQLMQGSPAKAVALGIFSMFYKSVNTLFESHK